MIIRLIFAFVVVLLSMYIGIWLQRDPGYVLITFQHWTIEASVWVALFVLLLTLTILYLAYSVLKKIVRTPLYWQDRRGQRRLNRAQAKTQRGLIEFGEGQWQTAKKHLIAAAANSDQPLVNYLTAARAAEKLGDHQQRDKYLHLAQTVAPHATVAIELTQAQLQIDNQEWEAAAETLHALHIIAPDHPYVLQLCVQYYQETQKWDDLIKLLPKLRPNKTFSAEKLYHLKKKAYLALFQENLSQPHAQLDMQEALKDLPKDLRQDPDIALNYAQHLINKQQDLSAEKYIRDSLRLSCSAELLNLYSQLNPELTDTVFIESLIKKNPHSSALHLCLGHLFLKKQLWGSARTHLEKSIQLGPTMQGYYLLGTLFEKLDEPHAACLAYKHAAETGAVIK